MAYNRYDPRAIGFDKTILGYFEYEIYVSTFNINRFIEFLQRRLYFPDMELISGTQLDAKTKNVIFDIRITKFSPIGNKNNKIKIRKEISQNIPTYQVVIKTYLPMRDSLLNNLKSSLLNVSLYILGRSNAPRINDLDLLEDKPASNTDRCRGSIFPRGKSYQIIKERLANWSELFSFYNDDPYSNIHDENNFESRQAKFVKYKMLSDSAIGETCYVHDVLLKRVIKPRANKHNEIFHYFAYIDLPEYVEEEKYQCCLYNPLYPCGPCNRYFTPDWYYLNLHAAHPHLKLQEWCSDRQTIHNLPYLDPFDKNLYVNGESLWWQSDISRYLYVKKVEVYSSLNIVGSGFDPSRCIYCADVKIHPWRGVYRVRKNSDKNIYTSRLGWMEYVNKAFLEAIIEKYDQLSYPVGFISYYDMMRFFDRLTYFLNNFINIGLDPTLSPIWTLFHCHYGWPWGVGVTNKPNMLVHNNIITGGVTTVDYFYDTALTNYYNFVKNFFKKFFILKHEIVRSHNGFIQKTT